jgi:5-methylcytosine-specific restriction protein B
MSAVNAYFTSEHFSLLSQWQDVKYDKNEAAQLRAYNTLKNAYEVTRQWATQLQERLFPAGYTEVRNAPTGRHQKFHPYNWARIYPREHAPYCLAITVGIAAETGFEVKIDLVDSRVEKPNLRDRLTALEKSSDDRYRFYAVLPIEEGLALSLDELVAWSAQAVSDFAISYDDVAEQLGLTSSASIDSTIVSLSSTSYDLNRLVADGCFVEPEELRHMLACWQEKKNLILQGSPGTGKTWLARRLAYVLIGREDPSRVRAVQFHANLSYEDFVRGWRPAGDGRLALIDGVFLQAVEAARATHEPVVVLIEEINRGNPAQIFGELLTLLEASKRTPRDAVELSYTNATGEQTALYLPENLYVIGTMNVADRSLALVDFALRRRFAFVSLKPRLGEAWKTWVVNHCGLAPALAEKIADRINRLNDNISDTLGNQFSVGHSYVTPIRRLASDKTAAWFRQIVETEIGPLLEEYWFDAPQRAHDESCALLEGWA